MESRPQILQQEQIRQIIPAPHLNNFKDEQEQKRVNQNITTTNSDNHNNQSRLERVRAINQSILSLYETRQSLNTFDQTIMQVLAHPEDQININYEIDRDYSNYQHQQISKSRLEKANQIRNAIMQRNIKKVQVLKNEIKKKQLENQISLVNEPDVGKCTIHNPIKQVINFPPLVNTDDVLQLLIDQNKTHIDRYKKLKNMPAFIKQKKFEAQIKSNRIHLQSESQLDDKLSLQHHLQQQYSGQNQKQSSPIDPQVGIHAVASQQSLLAASPSGQTYHLGASTINNFKAESPIRLQKFDPIDQIQPINTLKTQNNHNNQDVQNKTEKDMTETTPGYSKILLNSQSGVDLHIVQNDQERPSIPLDEIKQSIKIEDQNKQPIPNDSVINIQQEIIQNNQVNPLQIQPIKSKSELLEKDDREQVNLQIDQMQELTNENSPKSKSLKEKTYQIKTEGKQLQGVSSKKSLNNSKQHRIQRVRPPDQVMIETGKNLHLYNQVASKNIISDQSQPDNYDRFSVSADGNVEYKLYYIQELGKFTVPYLNNVVHNHYNHMHPDRTQRLKNIQSIIPNEKRAILEQYRAMEQLEKIETVKFKMTDLDQIEHQFDQNQLKFQQIQNQKVNYQVPNEADLNSSKPFCANIVPLAIKQMSLHHQFDQTSNNNINTQHVSHKNLQLGVSQNSNVNTGDRKHSLTQIVLQDQDSKTNIDGTQEVSPLKQSNGNFDDGSMMVMPDPAKKYSDQVGTKFKFNDQAIDTKPKLGTHSPSVGSESKTITNNINDKSKTEHMHSRPALESSRLTLQYKQSHGSFYPI